MQGATSGSFSPAQLRALITRCFRQPAGASREEQLDQAFTSLRLLSDQVHMQVSAGPGRGQAGLSAPGVGSQALLP